MEWQTCTTQNRVPKGMGVRLSPRPPRQNNSLTPVVVLFYYRRNSNLKIKTVNQREEAPMINFPPKLSQMTELLERLVLKGGVTVIDPDSTWVSPRVRIGRGTIIYPNSYLIGDDASVIGENCEIGPSAFLRDWFEIGSRVKIGFNAEIVRSTIGSETKIPHFCHVGEAVIGRGCNIAAGTVFCNYDGSKKQQITIGDYVFIGSGANLIAPLRIADHVYIAAGAIVSKDVEPYNFVIGVNKVVEDKKSYCWPKTDEKLPDNVHIHQPQDGWHIYLIDEHPIWQARGGY